jgi:predicted nucleic acid-binding Zn ribbon protein
MPQYEYKCPECGHVQELLGIAVADRDNVVMCDDATAHPIKGASVPCERLVASAGGFALRGGGWYSDGYQKGGK